MALPQGECMPEVPAREGRRKPEALPPDGVRGHGTTPQGCPNEGDQSRVGRRESHHTKLSCPLERDQALGGKLPREQTFESKRPVEAIDIAAGIDARNKTRKTV